MFGDGPTRRELIKLYGGTATGTLAGNPFASWSRVADSPGRNVSDRTPTTRACFDEFDAAFHEDGGLAGETNDSDGTGESGLLAWGESYVMNAYLFMYRAYRDTDYLDTFVEHADKVVANRDSERGVTDYRGKSVPAWRADSPYTVGRVALSDERERPTLAVRTATSSADAATVEITSGSSADTFGLTVRNPDLGRTTTYDGLSMAPDSDDYVVTRINREGFPDETPDRCFVTVADLRDDPADAGKPVAGKFGFDTPHHVFAAHTGMITFPLATFARLVMETPQLWNTSFYKEKARHYLWVARRAVAVHDHQWRKTDDGGGYYVFAPGSPTKNESVELPHNQSLALGRTFLQLAVTTGEPDYEKRAHELARTFRNDLEIDESGAHVWSYYWSDGKVVAGWSPDDPASKYRPWAPGIEDPVSDSPEDINHGHIDVDFVRLVYERWGFGRWEPTFVEADMERFARTYAENIAMEVDGAPAVRRNVDGTGPATGTHEENSPTWTVLAPWDNAVFDHSRSLYEAKVERFGPTPATLLGVAMLNYWKRATEQFTESPVGPIPVREGDTGDGGVAVPGVADHPTRSPPPQETDEAYPKR